MLYISYLITKWYQIIPKWNNIRYIEHNFQRTCTLYPMTDQWLTVCFDCRTSKRSKIMFFCLWGFFKMRIIVQMDINQLYPLCRTFTLACSGRWVSGPSSCQNIKTIHDFYSRTTSKEKYTGKNTIKINLSKVFFKGNEVIKFYFTNIEFINKLSCAM